MKSLFARTLPCLSLFLLIPALAVADPKIPAAMFVVLFYIFTVVPALLWIWNPVVLILTLTGFKPNAVVFWITSIANLLLAIYMTAFAIEETEADHVVLYGFGIIPGIIALLSIGIRIGQPFDESGCEERVRRKQLDP